MFQGKNWTYSGHLVTISRSSPKRIVKYKTCSSRSRQSPATVTIRNKCRLGYLFQKGKGKGFLESSFVDNQSQLVLSPHCPTPYVLMGAKNGHIFKLKVSFRSGREDLSALTFKLYSVVPRKSNGDFFTIRMRRPQTP